MKKSVKLFSLFLALVMLFGIVMPISASATTTLQNLNFDFRLYDGYVDFDVPSDTHTELITAYWTRNDSSSKFTTFRPNSNYQYELEFQVKPASGYAFSNTANVSFNGVALEQNGYLPVNSYLIRNNDQLLVKVKFSYLAFKDEKGANISAAGLSGFYIPGEVIPFSNIDAQFSYGHFDHFTVDGDASFKYANKVVNNEVTMGYGPSTLIAHYVNHDVYKEVIRKTTFSDSGEFVYKCRDCSFEDWRSSRDLDILDYEMEGFNDGVADSKILYYNGKTQHLHLMLMYGGRSLSSDEYEYQFPAESKKVGKYTAKVSVDSEYFEDEMTYNYNIYFAKPKVKIATNANTVKLTWKKVLGAKGYRIWSYNFKTKSFKKIKDTTSLSFKQTGRSPATKYGYLVRAYGIDKDGNTAFSPYSKSDVVSAFTLCNSPKVKASVSGKTVTLKWAKVKGTKFFRVYKYNTKTKKYKIIVKSAKKLSVKLTKQPKGTNYYLVRAFNSANAGSAYSVKMLAKARVRR